MNRERNRAPKLSELLAILIIPLFMGCTEIIPSVTDNGRRYHIASVSQDINLSSVTWEVQGNKYNPVGWTSPSYISELNIWKRGK